MTFKEKRAEHRREMKWLIHVGLSPIYLFMFTIPILVAINASGELFKYAIDRLVWGSFVGFVTVIAFVFLKEGFGYRLGSLTKWLGLPKFLRWKFEIFRDW